MQDGLSWRESIELEKKKIEEMSSKEKLSYFKTYYLKKVVVSIFMLVLLIWFIVDMVNSNKEILIAGCMVNVEVGSAGYYYMTDDYLEYADVNSKKNIAYLAVGNRLNFLDGQDMDNYSYEMALIAQLAAGDFHYMILDKSALERFQSLDVYVDMEEVLTKEQLEEYKDAIVYLESEEKGSEKEAAAIELTDTQLVKKYEIEPKEAYLVLVDVNFNKEKCAQFVNYILSE